MLNCTNCPWETDREACRACKIEQEQQVASLPTVKETVTDYNANLLKQGIGNALITLAQFDKN